MQMLNNRLSKSFALYLYARKDLKMKKWLLISLLLSCLIAGNLQPVSAQCSICTKTASQLGEKPAKALNAGILYLMFTPLAIAGFIGYRWWKTNREV